MKIGIFTDTYTPEINGVATSCNTLFNTLIKNGHEVYVFTTGKKTEIDETKHIIKISGKTIKRLYNYRLALPFNHKVLKEISKLNLDIIHVNTEYGVGILGFLASKKYRIPLVYTFHTMYEYYTYYITKGFLDGLFKKLVRRLIIKYVNRASEVIAPSENTKNYLQSIKCKKYINVVPTGIDLTKFLDYKIDDEKLKSLRKTMQIPDDFKIFVSLGRIAKEKNLKETIHYFDNFIKKHNIKAKLLIVGDGPYLSELKKEVKKEEENDNVLFLGRVEHQDVGLYYHLGDLFINSSLSETQGLTYLEAIASNNIVLARNAPYLKNIIIDGESGFLYDNEEDFDNKLLMFLSLDKNKLDKIKENALKNIDFYNIDNFYKKIMIVYNRAIKDLY